MTDRSPQRQAEANVVLRQVGQPLERTDAEGKATGRTLFAGDYVMPGMLHARVLRSEIASGRLKRLDASKARALPGVHCVLTTEELPDRLAATEQDLQNHGIAARTARALTPAEGREKLGLSKPH